MSPGALYDYTGDYNISFYAAGGLLMLASGTSFLVPVARRYLERHNGPVCTAASTPGSPNVPELIVSGENDGSPEDVV